MVNVQPPETGSMGPSPHRSVKFNTGTGLGSGIKEKLEQQMKEIEVRKGEAEKAVREAQAAASKKEESKPVAIAA
jgi:nuclear polyadenylated RNA-binding protein NAB2